MKYTYSLYVFLITFFVLLGCSGTGNEEKKESPNEGKVEGFVLSKENKKKYIEYRDSISVINKVLISDLYDSIGNIALRWIVTDRIQPEDTISTLKLKGLKLLEIKEKLNSKLNESIRSKVISHVNNFIDSKEDLLKQEYSSSSDFSEAVDSFIEGEYYTQKLISNNETYILSSITEEEYTDHMNSANEKIHSKIEETKENFSKYLSKEEWYSEYGEKYTFFDRIKQLGIWLLCLFFVSLLINIIQYARYRKKSKRLNAELLGLSEKLTSNQVQQSKKNDDDFELNPSQLSDHIVRNKIESAYETMHKTLVQSYHPDCVKVQEVTYNTLLSDTISQARSERFTSEQELASYISKQIHKHRTLLENDIQECIPKDVAIQQIHTNITVESFLSTINTAIVPESDIRSKVQSLKQNLIEELPSTTIQEMLSGIIQDFKITIDAHLTKMLEENLVFYFPYADVRGALSDEKKSKTKARDSALKLSLSPDDITKSTFHLLLDHEEMMQLGIMSYDSLLLPICELKPENYNSSGTRIEEIGTQGGTMVLEGGKWRVKDKLPIKIV